MKIVINSDYGGFGLSDEAFERYLDLKGWEFARVSNTVGGADYYKAGHIFEDDHYLSYYDIQRNDPLLVQVVEELAERANGRYSTLKIIEIPDDVKWFITDYDGIETIREEHRIWE